MDAHPHTRRAVVLCVQRAAVRFQSLIFLTQVVYRWCPKSGISLFWLLVVIGTNTRHEGFGSGFALCLCQGTSLIQQVMSLPGEPDVGSKERTCGWWLLRCVWGSNLSSPPSSGSANCLLITPKSKKSLS